MAGRRSIETRSVSEGVIGTVWTVGFVQVIRAALA
jgi:hypothetical protein